MLRIIERNPNFTPAASLVIPITSTKDWSVIQLIIFFIFKLPYAYPGELSIQQGDSSTCLQIYN
jgi:hypothetical protein